MPGGKAPKNKGDRLERDFVKRFGGERTFWQPEQGDEKRGDILNAPYIGRVECKARAYGFTRIYKWLEPVDALYIREDRQKPLVVMRADDLRLILEEMDELKRAANK